MWLGWLFPDYNTLDRTAATPHQAPFSTTTLRPLPTAGEVVVELGETGESFVALNSLREDAD